VSIIVDDSSPLWAYTGFWNVRGPGWTCTGGAANPDSSQVYNQTWHDTSDPTATASITFTSVSVSVYEILTWNVVPFIEQYTFALNDVPAHLFTFNDANPRGVYSYNTLVFEAGGLDARTNTTLTMGPVSSGRADAEGSPRKISRISLDLVSNSQLSMATLSPACRL
jgi:hypothetical protein